MSPRIAFLLAVALSMGALSIRPVAGQDDSLSGDGYWLDTAPLNDVFQYLAREARLQYFFNNSLSDPEFALTGHLRTGDPLKQMEDIAIAFGLNIYQKGSTVYAMNEQQLGTLPVEVMSYQLKYLRSSRPSRESGQAASGAGGLDEFEKLKSILSPMLTKGAGAIAFEGKTNTLLVTDNTVKLKRIRQLLEKIDQPKPQIAVSVRVLRVSNSQGKEFGVDWEASLGEGISLDATQSLNAIFNLPDYSTKNKSSNSGSSSFRNSGFQENYSETSGNTFDTVRQGDFSQQRNGGRDSFSDRITSFNSQYDDGPGLIFSPAQVSAIVYALEKDDIVTQEAAPTIITEDNEQGLISIIDRYPIITSTVTETSSGTNVSQEVRYQIDEKDPDPMEDPEKSREIGVTLSVTPTLLPDGTVRMKLRPRVAKIVDLIPGANGNVYPRVSESTAESISRVPSGQSLILGGFYDYATGEDGNKVPVLGSIPLLGNLFKYDKDTIEKVSLVFIITPSVYNALSPIETNSVNEGTRSLAGIKVSELYELSSRLAERESAPDAPNAPVGKAPAAPRRSWLNRLIKPDSRDFPPAPDVYQDPR